MSSNSGTVRTTRRRRLATDDRGAVGHPPSRLTEALPALVTALDQAAEDAGWGRPPALVRIMAWPAHSVTEGFDLGVRPLDDGSSVVEALSGFTAPADWLALGVVTEGNARHLDDREPGITPRRVRCVHLVDRSGASASALRLQGEDVSILDDHEPQGRIDDACRCALGLPTAPPVGSSVELWARLWLDRILARRAAAGGDGDPTECAWPELAILHPAVALVVHDDDQWQGQACDNIVRLGELLAEVHSWPVLRAACAAGDWPVDDVRPDVAAWLDDGAFSRWVLGGFAPVEHLADAVCAEVAPSVARRVRGALQAWRVGAGTAS